MAGKRGKVSLKPERLCDQWTGGIREIEARGREAEKNKDEKMNLRHR